MKKIIISIIAALMVFTSCQTNTELSIQDKEQIVKSVQKASENWISTFSQVYDDESLSKSLAFFTENNKEKWQTEPVFMSFNTEIMASTNEDLVKLTESLINGRISTTVDVKERYFSVLSEEKVLEVARWEASLMNKDSTVWNQGASINSTVWTKENGVWKILYFHQSDKY